MQDEYNREPSTPPAPTEQQVFCWNYGKQSAYDRAASPKKTRGALTFAVVMTLAFLISFGVLIAVLCRFSGSWEEGGYKEDYRGPDFGFYPDDDAQDGYQPEERVVYVREYDETSGVLTIPEIAGKVKPSVVGVKVTSLSGVGIGTGFVIREDGYIATNYHVIKGALNVTVIMQDGSEHTAEVVGGDELTDLAVLRIEGNGYSAVEFGDSSALLVGETVVAIGTPAGLELAGTVTDGIVSAINRNVKIYGDDGVLSKRMTLIQTNANINPGNSGGPLINDRGQVIGITTMKLTASNDGTGFEGIGFALPINGAREILNSIIETGAAGETSGLVTARPVLGITGGNAYRAQGYAADGILVATLTEGYDAVTSGLAVGDIIVEINGIRVRTVSELNAVTEDMSGGDTVTLTVNREGRELEITLALGWEK